MATFRDLVSGQYHTIPSYEINDAEAMDMLQYYAGGQLTPQQLNDPSIARRFADRATSSTNFNPSYGLVDLGLEPVDFGSAYREQKTAKSLTDNWQENQDFLNWVPQQSWFSFMDQNTPTDQVLATMSNSYDTAGRGAQDIINEAYKVFQSGGNAYRDDWVDPSTYAQQPQLGQSPTSPQLTYQYNPQDTWGSREFNPFDDTWDFEYYLSQQGLGPAPTTPRPGSGAAQYAADPNSLYSQADQDLWSQYQADLQTYEGGVSNVSQGQPVSVGQTQSQVTPPVVGENLFGPEGAYQPPADLSYTTTDGFPTRGGIKTGVWADNEYILPPVDYSRFQFNQGAPSNLDTGSQPSGSDINAIGSAQASMNLGNNAPMFNTPYNSGQTGSTTWNESMLSNVMDNPANMFDGFSLNDLFDGGFDFSSALNDFSLSDMIPDFGSYFQGAGDLGMIGDQYGTNLGTAADVASGVGYLTSGPLGLLASLAGRGMNASEQANIANQVLSEWGAIYNPDDYSLGGDAWQSAFLPFGDTVLNNMAGDMATTVGIGQGYGGSMPGYENILNDFLSSNAGTDISGPGMDWSAFTAPTFQGSGISVPDFTYQPPPSFAPINISSIAPPQGYQMPSFSVGSTGMIGGGV